MSQFTPQPNPMPAQSALDFAAATHDRSMMAEMSEALRKRRCFLAYQPIVLAQDPGRIAFWEGLIRMEDSNRRILPAADFMPVAETQDIGRQIDITSLEFALQALRDEPTLRLSVNMSARSIGYPRWVQTLENAVSDDPTLGERLIMEITESSAMLLPEVVRHFMTSMRRHGVSFALDDFGAGYTSFRYLRDFTFDIIKIDGQFIRGIADDPDNQVLTNALIMIAKQFDMFTVAEAVETAAEAAYLKSCGIDCLQGFHYGAPVAMPPWKEDNNSRVAAAF